MLYIFPFADGPPVGSTWTLPCHWEAISEVGFGKVVGTNNYMRELKYKRTKMKSQITFFPVKILPNYILSNI